MPGLGAAAVATAIISIATVVGDTWLPAHPAQASLGKAVTL